MESLWPKFEDEVLEENNSIQILRDQAKAIKTETNGIVHATFSKMNYKSGATDVVKTIGQIASAISSTSGEELLDKELAGKVDVNALFKKTRYKFEIYNTEYRFRLFVLNYSEMFPISLDVDGGILEDTQYKNCYPLSSNDELKDTLKEIFSSNKVRSVVSKMLQKGKDGE